MKFRGKKVIEVFRYFNPKQGFSFWSVELEGGEIIDFDSCDQLPDKIFKMTLCKPSNFESWTLVPKKWRDK